MATKIENIKGNIAKLDVKGTILLTSGLFIFYFHKIYKTSLFFVLRILFTQIFLCDFLKPKWLLIIPYKEREPWNKLLARKWQILMKLPESIIYISHSHLSEIHHCFYCCWADLLTREKVYCFHTTAANLSIWYSLWFE